MAVKKASKNEINAAAAGMSVKVYNAGGKVALPKAPVKLSSFTASKTPAAKLAQAQKSQPIYGPAIPKGFQMNQNIQKYSPAKNYSSPVQNYSPAKVSQKPQEKSLFSSFVDRAKKIISDPTGSKKKVEAPKLNFDFSGLSDNRQKSESEQRAEETQRALKILNDRRAGVDDRYEAENRSSVTNRDNAPKQSVRPQTVSESGEKTSFKTIGKAAKDILISNRGQNDEEVNKANPTFKETVRGAGKYAGEIGQGLVKIGGFAAQGLANRFGSEDYANKVRLAREKFGAATDQFVTPSTPGEAKVMKFGDVATLGLGALRSGAIEKGVGRIVTRAGEAGVSAKGVNRIISEGAKGAFNPLKTNVARASEIAQDGKIIGKVDEVPVPRENVTEWKILRNADTPDAPVRRLADEQMKFNDATAPNGRMAKTREEIPKKNTNKTDEIFEESDVETGRGKAYINVENGRGGLDKIELGEFDETGKFVNKKAEDGRDMWQVAEENQTNIRNGKRNPVKSDRPGDARAALQNRSGKKGLMPIGSKKLSSSSDSRLAKTAEEANIQDHIMSKIEKLKAQLKTAKDPDEYARISKAIDEETSIVRDYPKMGAEDKQFFKEKYYREDPNIAKKTIEDYQTTRQDNFEAPKIGSLRKSMQDRVIRNKGKYNGSRSFNHPTVGETVLDVPKDPLLQEAGKYKSAEEFVKAKSGNQGIYNADYEKMIAKNRSEAKPLSKQEWDFLDAETKGDKVKIYRLSTNGEILPGDNVSVHNVSKFINKDGSLNITGAKMGITQLGGRKDVKLVEQWIPKKDLYQTPAGTQLYAPNGHKSLTDLYNKAQGGKVNLAVNSAGAGAGFEEGEDGKIRYNAEKGLLGLGAGMIGMKGAKALSKGGFNSSQYVKQMAKQQRNAEGKTTGLLAKTKSFLAEFKKKAIDTNAPIEDLIAQQQKKLNFEAIPRYDITNAIDRVYRSTSMAGAFAKENGLEKVIKKVDDLDEFDQYLIAKHGLSLEKEGIQTGRDAAKDRLLIEAVGDKYAKEEKVVRDYSHKLMDYAVESGLISRKTADELKVKYPDYVPYNRIFGEDEAVAKGTGGGVASLGSQSVVQRIKGSQREVQSPMRSFLEKTTTAFQQGEKNKTAQILTSYDKLPDNPFGLEKVVGTKSPGDNTISVFKDGIKETWKVNKDIADAAKALNVEQIGLLGKIFVAPVRVAKLGITGINLPFVAANVARDIVSAFVNSKNSFRSLIAMPEAIFQALGHGKLYKEMLSEGAMQTSFDITRNQVAPTIRDTRGLLGNKGMERVKYIASTPTKLFRAVEDIIGRSEELNRIAQYKGAYKGAIAKGMTPIDARAVAARAARENSVNFARKGEYGSAMNALVLYLNAGVQGSRTLLRSIKTRPVATSAKIVTVVGMPLAITTSWNLSDPKRREAYEGIPEFEKENNFIFIPNNPTKDENGKWNVVKIPIQPGLSNVVQPIRYALERLNGLDPQTFAQMASQITGAVSPVQVPFDVDSTRKTVGQLLPQAIKPTAEAVANKNFFTGAPVIPRKLEGLSPELQVKENTSGTAMALGKKLDVSPLQIEHFIKETFGSVGLQFLNASDRTLAATGKISPDDIGGQDIMSAVTARFNKAAGGAVENALWEKQAQAKEEEKSMKYEKKQEFMPLYNQIQELKNSNPDKAQKMVDDMTDEQYEQYKTVKKSERAKSSTQFHDLLDADPKQAVKYVRSQSEEEQQRLIDNMTDEQYDIYDSAK